MPAVVAPGLRRRSIAFALQNTPLPLRAIVQGRSVLLTPFVRITPPSVQNARYLSSWCMVGCACGAATRRLTVVQ